MTAYRLARQANADLETIVDFISKSDPAAAVRVLDKLLESFRLLAKERELGAARGDLTKNLRVFRPGRPAANYLVFYYPIDNGIEVSHVIHGAQDWLGMFQRGER